MGKPKTLSGLFLNAARNIVNRRAWWICDAIEKSRSYPVELRTEAKAIVQGRLGKHNFYTQWVKENHPELFRDAELKLEVQKKACEGRIAWCRALAEEFKESE